MTFINAILLLLLAFLFRAPRGCLPVPYEICFEIRNVEIVRGRRTVYIHKLQEIGFCSSLFENLLGKAVKSKIHKPDYNDKLRGKKENQIFFNKL